MKRWCAVICLVIALAGLVVFTSQDVVLGLSGPNLVVNPGFEAATADPWSKYGGVFDTVTAPDPVHGGNRAARHEDTTSDSTKWLRQNVPVTGGQAYEFSAWAWLPAISDNVDSVFLRVAWYAGSDCSGSQSGTEDVGGFDASFRDTWQQLQGIATAPAGANCAQLRLILDPAAGQDPVVYWDDVFFGSQDTPTVTPIPTIGSTPTPTPTSTSTPSPAPTASPTAIPTGVLVNEYLPAPNSGQSEYVELHNANAFSIDIGGWQIDDIAGGSSPYTLPAGSTIPANGLFLVTRSFGLNNSGDTVRLLAPDGSLRDSHSYVSAFKGAAWSRRGDGAPTWTDKYPRTPGAPNLPAVFTLSGNLYLGQPPDTGSGLPGHYIGLYGSDDPDVVSRWLANAGTRSDGGYSLTFDTAQALYRHYTLRPSVLPGHPWSGVDTTFGIAQPPDRIRFDNLSSGSYSGNRFWMAAESTPTQTPTPLPADFVTINECLPSPRDIDFDGNGMADYQDEYIELYNPQAHAVDLGGWWLDDSDGGSQPWQLPVGTTIQADGFLLFFRSETGIALNNDGDSVRLLAPDGVSEADHFDYEHSSADTPWSRSSDGGGDWTESYQPSPGGPNLPPPETLTPTSTLSPTPDPSKTVTPTTTLTPSPTPTPSPTSELTPSPSPTITRTPTSTPALPSPVITLNEYLPAPRNIDWNGDGEVDLNDEYIELYNPNTEPVDLGGWQLDDQEGGSRPYLIPPGSAIPARGFLLFFRSDTGVALNNSGDDMRLFDPHKQLMDQHHYPGSRLDVSWSRTVDGAGSWTDTYLPSPGSPNIAPTATLTPTATAILSPTPTPTITPTPFPAPADGAIALNEVLTSPKNVDWDGDGVADHLDEWVEIYNGGSTPADLAGWRLWRGQLGDNGLPDGYYYELPSGTILSPGGFMLIFRSQSDLHLPARNGDLHLVRPDGRLADSYSWSGFPDFDRSFSRYPDGDGPWKRIHVTPGRPNRTFSTPRPTQSSGNNSGLGVGVESIARAYQLAADTRITVEGVVSVPPGLFNSKTVYIQDAMRGLKLYLRRGNYPDLRTGDHLRVTGYLRDYHGQRELSIPGQTWVTFLGQGAAPRPRFVRTGAVGEVYESRLVMVVGQVTGFRQNSFWLDDGSGGAKITVDSDLPWQRPYFEKGDTWAVVGVVTQYDDTYRINPRYQTDISPPPSVLPVTGSDLRR